VNSPQRCVSIIAFGTYGDVARCGWECCISEQWRIKDCGIQSAALCCALLTCARFLLEILRI
ncbi:MAG: hypothetical protein K2N70_02345, partial [Helicobacter sp.]|nr:hypothetical protein [Helicobacter sp.]